MRLDEEGRVPGWAAAINVTLLGLCSWALVYLLVQLFT